MVPAITSPRPIIMGRNGSCLAGSISSSRETTPTVAKSATTVARGDAELVLAFKSHLTDIRSLVTCSICDQLLYEPWTLGCGHTYCYSCLCNWFVPNKKKKTCPECRTTVKQMPAPAFLVKQMVEIFIKRGETMPSDESIDQHQKKQAEEIADVDKDRNGAEGLFKGTFPAPKRDLIFDDGDGVYRCPRCLTEHEGGPTCANCDLAVEHDYDLSEMDDDFDPDDLENLEVDLDDDLGGGLRAEFRFAHIHHPHYGNPLYFHNHDEDDSEDSETDSSELDPDEDDEDDDSSLRGFVVPDDEQPPAGLRANQPIQHPINISDDDSDEGGAISVRRRRRAGNRVISGSSSPSAPSIVSVGSSSVSEANEVMLQRAGWSPLDQGNESDLEGEHHYPDYASEEEHTDGSDTETIGNGGSGDESDRSETPRYEYPLYGDAGSSDGDEDDDVEVGAGTDRDGDTEMSVSPSSGRYRSASAVSDGYSYGDPQSRSVSVESFVSGYGVGDCGVSRGSRGVSVESEHYGHGAEELGSTNQIHDLEEDSSDSLVAPRRHRRQYPNSASVQQYYDPRISVMLAEHQQIRGAQDPQDNLTQLEDQMRRAPIVEPASRNRRMTAYRRQPSRRIDPLRSSRSPSATRVISSSARTGRLPPLYSRRN